MTTLTERRQADRARMSDIVAELARTHGLRADIVPGDRGQRHTEVRISGPHTLGLTVRFDGNSGQTEPDTYVLSWHMRPWDVEGTGWLLKPSEFQNVNPHHGTKATDIARGWDQLGRVLTLRFRAIESGAAFTHRYPVGQVIEYMSFNQETGYSVGQVMGLAPPEQQAHAANPLYMVRNRSGGQPFPMRESQLRTRREDCPLFGPSKHRMKLDPLYAKGSGEDYTCTEHGGQYGYDAMAAHLEQEHLDS